jgi:hypothetical protein
VSIAALVVYRFDSEAIRRISAVLREEASQAGFRRDHTRTGFWHDLCGLCGLTVEESDA